MINAQNLSFNNIGVVNIVAGHQVNSNPRNDDSQERGEIAHWLSPLNFKTSQSQFLQIHKQGTGNWFLESQTFQDWRDGWSQTLWCPGNPGAGKTILASVVVDHLQMSSKDNNVGIACIYCSYKEQSMQTVTNLIASLLKQFVQDCDSISDNMKAFYYRHKVRNNSPTLDELSKALEQEMKNYSRVFIVVDALDECSDSNSSRVKLLEALRSLSGPINLMVTSRDLPSIQQHFLGASRLYIRATDEDVAKYVQGQLNDCPGLENLRDIATKRIVESARGMFLLARLHMNALFEQNSEEEVLHSLDNLPDEMDQIYDEAVERIERQRNTKELAKRALSWIIYASRPLSVEELQHALAVSPRMTELSRRALIFEWKLTSVCAGLVVIDEKERVVRLAHYTTQQYFENRRATLFLNAEAAISATCLTYLSFNIFARGYCNDDVEFESLLKDNPLLDYAARNWGHHARRHQESIIDLAVSFLGEDSKVACASQVMLTAGRHWTGHSQCFPRDLSGVHISAYYGLERIICLMLDSGADADKVDGYNRTPLSYATENGHDIIVRLLLGRDDVEADSKDSFGRTPLSIAAQNGHDAIVKLLLARDDVEADWIDLHGRTPLSSAAESGHDSVMKLLLARGDVKADRKNSAGRTLLSLAAQKGNDTVVELLLARDELKADSKDPHGRTPLSFAAENGHDSVVKLLLTRDDVKADWVDQYGRTPLSLAAENGHDSIVKLLLTRADVEPDRQNWDDRTALSLAAVNGYDIVVKLLLARDDVQADWVDRCGRTPLSFAAESGHDSVIKLLLTRDDVAADRQNLDGQTLLSLAAEKGDDAMVKLLLARGDVEEDSKDGYGRTPLSFAAMNGHDVIVKRLLTRDVKADWVDQYGRTPLSIAAENGHDSIVKLLLTCDDVKAGSMDLYGRTPLSFATKNGHDSIVRRLLTRDVKADSMDRYGRTPLSLAVENGHDSIVEMLLARDDVKGGLMERFRADSKDLHVAEDCLDLLVKLLLPT